MARIAAKGETMLPAERRIARTRAEIEDLLIPRPGEFPRSQTMRFLTGRNGKAIAVGAVAALVASRPRLGMALVRLLPAGRIFMRML